jgi:CheY-like chemotaxis protein
MTGIADNGASKMIGPMGSSTRCVLIVDDDPDVHKLLGYTLRSLPVRLTYALNGQDALNAIAAECPDLIILDLQMPEMSGFELLEHLGMNAGTADIPVVVFSGFVEVAYTHANNMIDWPVQVIQVIKKPVRVSEIRELVREWLCPSS